VKLDFAKKEAKMVDEAIDAFEQETVEQYEECKLNL
jgi:hypothetical protein